MIRSAIIEGKFRSGQHLREVALAKQLGMSRAPIREAFRILEIEGLVVTHLRKGVRVRELTPEDVKSIYDLRSALDALAIRLAIPNLEMKDIVLLEKLLGKMELCVAERDNKAYKALNIEFHSFFYQKSRNEWLRKVYNDLGNHIMRVRTYSFSLPERLSTSFKEHVQLVQLIKEKKSAEAEKLIESHSITAGDFLLQHLTELGKNSLLSNC